jgi:hypothetical protein
MRRRTTVIGLTAIALAGCGVVAAALASTAPASAGSSTETTAAGGSAETTAANGLSGSPARSYSLPVVFGMFEEQGGPVKPGPNGGTQTRPLSGVVMFKNKSGRTTTVTAGSNGHFTAQVPAGTYTVTARSPQIEQGNPNGTRSDPPCAGPKTVVVQSKTATPLTLVCYVP